MDIGLIDVDGHNFPNLALMKLSAYSSVRTSSGSKFFTFHSSLTHSKPLPSNQLIREQDYMKCIGKVNKN